MRTAAPGKGGGAEQSLRKVLDGSSYNAPRRVPQAPHARIIRRLRLRWPGLTPSTAALIADLAGLGAP